jgi:hypothetical protein
MMTEVPGTGSQEVGVHAELDVEGTLRRCIPVEDVLQIGEEVFKDTIASMVVCDPVEDEQDDIYANGGGASCFGFRGI